MSDGIIINLYMAYFRVQFKDSCYFGFCDDAEEVEVSADTYCDCRLDQEKYCEPGIDMVTPDTCQFSPVQAAGQLLFNEFY